MRRWWIASLGLIACGGTTRPERVPGGPQRHQQPVEPRMAAQEAAIATDRALAERWDDLALTSANWTEKVEEIRPEYRVMMAAKLLRDGNFACEATPPAANVCKRAWVQRLPGPTATLSDPCLRRQLALWAIDQLEDEATILELHDELTQLIQLPEPERELAAAAIEKMPTGFLRAGALWEAKAAGHDTLVAGYMAEGLEGEDLRQAASAFHLDAAVLALDPVKEVEIYSGAILDSALLPTTRIAAVHQLTDHYAELSTEQAEEALDAIRWATGYSGNCTIATAASADLSKLSGGDYQLSGGPFEVETELIDAACAALAVDARGVAWKPVVTTKELTIVSHTEDEFRVDALWTQYPFAYDKEPDGVPDVPEADPDGDGNVATLQAARTTRWSKRFILPYSEELKLALPNCVGADCYVPDSSVWFHLDIVEERGGKRLRGLERHERLHADC